MTPSKLPSVRRFTKAIKNANTLRPKAAGRPFGVFVAAMEKAATIFVEETNKKALEAMQAATAKVALVPQFKRAVARVSA